MSSSTSSSASSLPQVASSTPTVTDPVAAETSELGPALLSMVLPALKQLDGNVEDVFDSQQALSQQLTALSMRETLFLFLFLFFFPLTKHFVSLVLENFVSQQSDAPKREYLAGKIAQLNDAKGSPEVSFFLVCLFVFSPFPFQARMRRVNDVLDKIRGRLERLHHDYGDSAKQ
jgi:hypothetical protein